MTDGFRGFKRSEISFPDRKKQGAKPDTTGVFAKFRRVRPPGALGNSWPTHPVDHSDQSCPHTLQKDNAWQLDSRADRPKFECARGEPKRRGVCRCVCHRCRKNLPARRIGGRCQRPRTTLAARAQGDVLCRGGTRKTPRSPLLAHHQRAGRSRRPETSPHRACLRRALQRNVGDRHSTDSYRGGAVQVSSAGIRGAIRPICALGAPQPPNRRLLRNRRPIEQTSEERSGSVGRHDPDSDPDREPLSRRKCCGTLLVCSDR